MLFTILDIIDLLRRTFMYWIFILFFLGAGAVSYNWESLSGLWNHAVKKAEQTLPSIDEIKKEFENLFPK